jgi:hypothetical protein
VTHPSLFGKARFFDCGLRMTVFLLRAEVCQLAVLTPENLKPDACPPTPTALG